MVVESHWRVLKQDYLHQFNRPRIDLVAWVLVTQLYPFYSVRMEALLRGDTRTGRADWRNDLKATGTCTLRPLLGLFLTTCERIIQTP